MFQLICQARDPKTSLCPNHVLPNPLTKHNPSPIVTSRFPTPVTYPISIACPSVFQPTRMLLSPTAWCILLPLVTPCQLYPNFREAPVWPFCFPTTPLGFWLCLFTPATVPCVVGHMLSCLHPIPVTFWGPSSEPVPVSHTSVSSSSVL